MNTLNTENWQWSEVGQEGDNPQEGRQGHSLNALKNCLILFGGERKYNKSMRIRECFSDCRIYNTTTRQWSLVRQYGEYLESRRNHLSCIVGKFLIIIGGVDSNGKYLSDVCSINLESSKTSHLEHINGYDSGIAFSACCAVFKNDNKIENLYSPIDKNQPKPNGTQSYLQGIYVFGGRKENGDAMNRLRILQIGQKPLKWIDLEFSGKPPEPRFSHTLNFYKEFNSLVLIGGRNESYYSKEGSNIFQDIYIFSLDFSEWIKADIKGQGIPQRCSHSSTILDSKIIIFGELDQRKAHSFLKEHNQRLLYQHDKNLVNSNHLLHQFSIEGIISNDNALFQIPSSHRQQKHYHNNFLNNHGSNHHRHQHKKETFIENSKEQELTVDADTMKQISHQPISTLISQPQNTQIHHELDRTVNNRYEGVKTYLPLPLLPKRSTLRFSVSTIDLNKDQKKATNEIAPQSPQDGKIVTISNDATKKRTSILKGSQQKRNSILGKSKMNIQEDYSSASSQSSKFQLENEDFHS